MCPTTPGNSATPGPCGLPLWLGMAFMLILLMVAPHAHASDASPSADQQPPTAWGLTIESTPHATRHVTPTEPPHCHHDHAWRPASGILPRGEAQDLPPDLLILMPLAPGPAPHVIKALGASSTGPLDRASAPLYLLTQRFRS